MNKILLVTIAILMLAMVGIVGIVGCAQESSQQVTVPSPPPPPVQEVQESEPPPESLESLNPPPGIDPITGRPKVTPTPASKPQDQEPQEYGTPPGYASTKTYPYSGEVLPGTEDKVQLFYNVLYGLDEAGKYYVEMKCTNLSNQVIEEVVISVFQEDSSGKILPAGRIGLAESSFKPGDWCPGLGGWISTELTPPVKVVAKITYLKLN